MDVIIRSFNTRKLKNKKSPSSHLKDDVNSKHEVIEYKS